MRVAWARLRPARPQIDLTQNKQPHKPRIGGAAGARKRHDVVGVSPIGQAAWIGLRQSGATRRQLNLGAILITDPISTPSHAFPPDATDAPGAVPAAQADGGGVPAGARAGSPASAQHRPSAFDPAWWPHLGRALLPFAERSGAMVAIKDAGSGRYLWVDEAMAGFIGLPSAEVVGRTDGELFDGVTAAALRAGDQAALSRGSALSAEHRIEREGHKHDFGVLRILLSEGPPPGLLCSIWTDRSEQLRREAQLRSTLLQLEQQQQAYSQLRREIGDQSLRDVATGLYTASHFIDHLRREVDLSTREHREFTLVNIELDPFSPRVAALGEPARDRILEAMGRLLKGNTRVMDASCRLDDQRFAVLLSGVGLATGHARMEGLRRQCATQIVVHGGVDIGFTVAMGVASFPHTANTHESVVDAAAAALFESRRRGGNTVVLAAIRFESVA
jgi:diguanylate cyclase (GGDEF)-like protein